MATAVAVGPRLSVPVSTYPKPKLWTCAEFHELGELGLLEGRRAMLIDGVILEQGPMNPPHAALVSLVEFTLMSIFGSGWFPRAQLPIVLGLRTDPMPDVAVVAGHPRNYLAAHPTSAALIVEIADSSFLFDTTEKASLYAAGGIEDYWVVDVVGRQLLVFRDPRPDASQPHGHGYAQHLTFAPGQSVAPLAAPNNPVAVADLLP